MILDIFKIQNPAHVKVLRSKSDDVTDFNQELADLTKNMLETMVAANGVGLAAPQVGRNLNIFVMETTPEDRKDTRPLVLINPYTVIEVGDPYSDQEGCLSVPGYVGYVKRFKQVGCVYQDVTGQRRGITLEGLPARIYQHEFDHLQGVLYIDRAVQDGLGLFEVRKKKA